MTRKIAATLALISAGLFGVGFISYRGLGNFTIDSLTEDGW